MNDPLNLGIIVVCAVIGYIAVSIFIGKRESTKARQSDEVAGKESKSNNEGPVFWYEILNVNQTASVEEIKAAYRIEIAKYHPDRVATLGHELKVLAEIRSKKINIAYAEGMRTKGGRRGD